MAASWETGAREAPGRVPVGVNKWGFKAPSEAAGKKGVALSRKQYLWGLLTSFRRFEEKRKIKDYVNSLS